MRNDNPKKEEITPHIISTSNVQDISKKEKRLQVIVYGDGRVYDRCNTLLHYFETLGEIEVIEIASGRDVHGHLDGWPLQRRDMVNWKRAEVIILAVGEQSLPEVRAYLLKEQGITKIPLIAARLLAIEGFSFRKYLRLIVSPLSIITMNCWGGASLSSFWFAILLSVYKYVF